jgi:hypothetical protein
VAQWMSTTTSTRSSAARKPWLNSALNYTQV